MGRFTTPRRMGSTGWLMHTASRSAYNNRGSNAAYAAERNPMWFLCLLGFIVTVPPLVLLFLMYLLVNPGFGVFVVSLIGLGGLIQLMRSRIRRGN